MKKVIADHHYNTNVDHVFRFFADKEAVVNKYTSLGARNYQLKKRSDTGKILKIDARREIPVSDEVPKALRKFFGEWNKVRQQESWSLDKDGSRLCQMHIDIDGIPIRIKGKMHLTATKSGCINKVALEAKSSLPIIGNAIASFIGKLIVQQMDGEYEYIKSA